MRLRRPLPAVQGDTLHIVGVGDNRIGKEPTSPVPNLVAGVGIGTGFVRENDDVATEHDQDVTQFLSASLVAVEIGVAPKAEKGPFAEAREVFLGRCDSAGFLQLCNPCRVGRIAWGDLGTRPIGKEPRRLPRRNGFELSALDGAGDDRGKRGTGNDGEFGSNGGGIGCELALRVPVAEFVRGLVRMSREAT